MRIGALLANDKANIKQHEFILNQVINDVNIEQQEFLTNHYNSKLTANIEYISHNDSFEADRKACGLLNKGVVALLGTTKAGQASQHVQAICDALEIPYIDTQPNLMLSRSDLAINMYPSFDLLARAYIDLITAWNWTSFAIVYEDSDAMIRLQDVLKEQSDAPYSSSTSASLSLPYSSSNSQASNRNTQRQQQQLKKINPNRNTRWNIKLFQFTPGSSYRDIFWKVKRSGETNILLDISREHLHKCLKNSQQVGLMTEKHSYLITSLDVHTVDLEDFMFGKTKITSLQITDSSKESVKRMMQKLASSTPSSAEIGNNRHSQALISSEDNKLAKFSELYAESALIYDAIQLLAQSIKELDGGQSIRAQSLSCSSQVDTTWRYGSSIINYMRSATMDGLTGPIAFDMSGKRSNVVLNIMCLNDEGLHQIGTWNEIANVSLQIEPNIFSKFYIDETDSIDTLIITAKRTKPYFMLKSTSSKQEGNDRFEGYAVDLIHELSNLIGFKYKFKEVDDQKYGAGTVQPNGTKIWNGMIGEIISGRADLAISDLTITSAREEAVDFTLPFMNTGISILFKKPENKVTTLFSFLSPFSLDVWLWVLGAYTTVSLILYFVGRISPYEWTNAYPCRQQDTVLHNSFSVLNSFWFTIGSLMQQGSDLAPKSMATRSMAGIWYFFTLIMISSYTANLAAFLTVERIVYPIENAKDLSEQTEIKYGSVESGSTRTFFKDSHIEIYKKIYKFMEDHQTYVKSNEEGKERVVQGNFAFFMESTSIEYITERNCNLTQIGSLLDNKGYGIATSKSPRYKRPYRNLLSSGILRLQETGMLHMLKNRWWKEKDGVSSCSDEGKGGGVTELSLANVGGVFVVLLGGMGIAFVIALIESFLYLMNKKRKLDRDSMCDQMMADLVFALSCQSSTKPARKKHKNTTNNNNSNDTDNNEYSEEVVSYKQHSQ